MAEVALAALNRPAQGSANTRRLRKEGRIPGIMYGHGIQPVAVSVAARDLRLALSTDAGVNALLQLEVDGKKHLAFPRAIEKHPVRGTVNHVDFLVVNRNEEITAEIPITFVGEASKVTKQGGTVEHQLTSLEITATATNIPSHLELDVSELELEGSLRVQDIKLPVGVTTAVDGEETVVVGRVPRVTAEDAADAAASEEAGAAPEAAPASEG